MSFHIVRPDDYRISASQLHDRVVGIFRAAGSGEVEAGRIADHLVLANLMGHDSHGISLIPLYLRMVREGKVVPNTRPSMALDAGALMTFEAHRGFGQSTAVEALTLAIERARSQGSAIVGLRNSHHVGRIGHWAEQCAAAGLVSVHLVNVIHSPPVVAPFAGADARLHTNPIAIGVPRERAAPLILDFATSRAAQGKMRIAMHRGLSVPPGYLIDAQGRPSTDPSVVYLEPLGALLPFGDHKGSGLGLMCDILAGALTGGGTLHAGTQGDGIYINNMLSILIDPQRLGGAGTWQRDLIDSLAYFTDSPERTPGEPVLLPGEPERRTRRQREAEGIPIDATTWRLVNEAAGGFGV